MADRREGAAQNDSERARSQQSATRNRMPAGSRFYERVVPALLILFAVATLTLILFAAGVLLGIVPFS